MDDLHIHHFAWEADIWQDNIIAASKDPTTAHNSYQNVETLHWEEGIPNCQSHLVDRLF